MAKRIVDDTSLIKVADAIRNKCGASERLIFPDGFESAIASISITGDGITPSGTIYITENNKTYDVTTFADAEVNIQLEEVEEVKLQSKAVTPNADGWVVEPDTGYTGLSKVTVSGDSDLKAENIKKNVNIFGVTGTYEGDTNSGSSSGDIVYGDEIEVDSLSELHSWNKYSIGGTVTETKVDSLTISSERSGTDSVYEPVDYADSYNTSAGKIALVNPTENVTFTSSANAQVLLGKYIQTYATSNQYATTASPTGKFYRIDSTADVAYSKGTYPTPSATLTVSPAYRLNYAGSEDQLIGIVVSEDSNAYPQNGEQGGYKYVYNGTLDSGSCDHTAVTQATPTITVNATTGVITATSTQTAGLVSAGTKSATKQITHTNLTAENIKSGVSIFGITGTYSGSSGSSVELPTFTRPPATEADVASSKQFIDESGNLRTGSMGLLGFGGIVDADDDVEIVEKDDGSKTLIVGGYTKNTETNRVDPGTALIVTMDETHEAMSVFGNATEDDVRAGKTFTSAAGFVKTGRAAIGSGSSETTIYTKNIAILNEVTSTESSILKSNAFVSEHYADDNFFILLMANNVDLSASGSTKHLKSLFVCNTLIGDSYGFYVSKQYAVTGGDITKDATTKDSSNFSVYANSSGQIYISGTSSCKILTGTYVLKYGLL